MMHTTRRKFIAGFSGIAAASVTAGAATALSLAPVDPLIDAIKAYRAGLIAFGNLSDDEYGKVETYEPWQEVLDNWNEPARTREGAIEALKAALGDDDGLHGCEGADRMVRAALGYLESLPT